MTSSQELFRKLPSVDFLLTSLEEKKGKVWFESFPRPLFRELANLFLDTLRNNIKLGSVTLEELEANSLFATFMVFVEAKVKPHFKQVINATGVVIHTNLGRSLLAESAVKAVSETAAAYSNLEFDLETGKRGTRYSHVEELICRLTGAEAALVVNNNAAAVLLALDTHCRDGEVIVSRGELVEIGGSFRIPAVMEKSGCLLKEVGTTNRTHLEDYANAICDMTKAIMKVHTSNYRISGFTKSLSVKDLRELADEKEVLLMEDLGSGSLFDFSQAGFPELGEEPTVQQVVKNGADIVTFSGDKVLGGPQAGIIVGKKKYIDGMKKNHLTRALRIDKMTLAALEATLRLYLDPELAQKNIPTLSMILASKETLKRKAKKLALTINKICNNALSLSLREDSSRIGGGSFPEKDLPTTLVALQHNSLSAQAMRDILLNTTPPLIGRIENALFCLDPRTLHEREFQKVAALLHASFAE